MESQVKVVKIKKYFGVDNPPLKIFNANEIR